MRPPERSRISVLPLLIALIIGAVTILSFIFMGPMIAVTSSRYQRELSDTARHAADRLAKSLAVPAWNVDEREIEIQLEMALTESDAYSTTLSLKNIDTAPISKRIPGNANIRERSLISERRTIAYKDQEIADLELVFTTAFMERRLASGILQQTMLILSLDASLIFVLLLLLRAFIILPLRRIEHWASFVSEGRTEPLPSGGERGEIASLRDSISRMVSLLNERYDAMVAREREYRSLFESSPVATWELDCSTIKKELGDSGTIEARHLGMIRVHGANKAALLPLGIDSPPQQLVDIIGGSDETFALLAREIASLRSGTDGAYGKADLELPLVGRRSYIIRFAVLAGYEDTWSRVIATAEDITDRVVAEESLRRSLSDKETLVQELYHRTHNSLQLMNSIISLRSSQAHDQRSAEEMRELELRVRAMAMAQDQLTISGDVSLVDLGDYLRELLETIAAEAPGKMGRIRANVRSSPVTTLIDAAVPVGLIAVELATNSIEHGFPDGRQGRITATIERDSDGSVLISIGDDGIGPKHPFDPRATASLGLQTVITLAEKQLRGSVEFDSTKGFECTIHFDDRIFARRV